MLQHDAEPKLYQPIASTEIRLLSIEPGFPSEPIDCAFVTVDSLAEAPSYDALSYVWGSENSPDPIFCNGVRVNATKQLVDALKHLRRFPGWRSVLRRPKDHPLRSGKNVWGGFASNRHEHEADTGEGQDGLLWIDALCINQQDEEERANQVKMMGKIYAKALNVKIWLGKEPKEPLPASQDTGWANGTHLGAYGPVPVALSFIAQALRNISGPSNTLVTLRPAGDSFHRNVSFGFPAPDAPEWDVVRHFFTNPWFERVWVVQEVVIARRATVLIGDWEIDWATIGQAALWFQSKGYATPAVLKYQIRSQQDLLPVAKSASMHTLCSWPGRKIPLLNLLHEFRSRQATDARDKVYATFGIAEELVQMEERGFHSLVEPNYHKTTAQIYRDIAKYLIIEHGHLAVLSHVGTSLTPTWPSWVPDWRHDKVSNTFASIHGSDIYNASAGQPLQIDMSRSLDVLALQGIEVDVVTAYCDKLVSYGFGYSTYQEEIDFARMAWQLAQPTETSESTAEETIVRTFIETLVSGTRHDPSLHADALRWFSQHAHLFFDTNLYQRLKQMMHMRPDSGHFHEAFVKACVDRRFFVTRSGRMGIGPDAMNEGDVVAILFGGDVPYIVRPIEDSFKFIGECYVHGLMHGEAVQTWKDGGSRKQIFELR